MIDWIVWQNCLTGRHRPGLPPGTLRRRFLKRRPSEPSIGESRGPCYSRSGYNSIWAARLLCAWAGHLEFSTAGGSTNHEQCWTVQEKSWKHSTCKSNTNTSEDSCRRSVSHQSTNQSIDIIQAFQRLNLSSRNRLMHGVSYILIIFELNIGTNISCLNIRSWFKISGFERPSWLSKCMIVDGSDFIINRLTSGTKQHRNGDVHWTSLVWNKQHDRHWVWRKITHISTSPHITSDVITHIILYIIYHTCHIGRHHTSPQTSSHVTLDVITRHIRCHQTSQLTSFHVTPHVIKRHITRYLRRHHTSH